MEFLFKLAVSVFILTYLGAYIKFFRQLYDDHYHYDLIIVGTGLAGLTSAIQAYKMSSGNLKILLLEKEGTYGGNSIYAASGINLLHTPAQKKNYILDSFDMFFKDTIKSSKNHSDPELVKILVEDAANIYKFFSEFDVNLTEVTILGGHSAPRTHRPADAQTGVALISALMNYITSHTNIEIRLNSVAIELLTTKNRIINGIKYLDKSSRKNYSIFSNAIILATGGFAHIRSLLKEFAPNLVEFPTTSGPQTDELAGIILAKNAGARLIDMGDIQLHPTGFVDPVNRFSKEKTVAPELLRGVGGLLLNQNGWRFCNELGTNDYVTKKIYQNCRMAKGQPESIIAISMKGVREYGKSIKMLIDKGLLTEFLNWEELCDYYNLPIENVKKMLEEYKLAIELDHDKQGKTFFPSHFALHQKVYGGVVTPSLHSTLGGVKINTRAEVLAEDNQPIHGLFGAGEVTGGIHGVNRLAGNSLLECTVFGRIAGRTAYEYLLKGKNSNIGQ